MRFTAQMMDDAESNLRRAAQSAPQEMERTAQFALGSFEALSAGLLAYLHRYAVPAGKG